MCVGLGLLVAMASAHAVSGPAGAWKLLVRENFESYREVHLQVNRAYKEQKGWRRMSLRNIASVGRFSSDRTIADYVRDIWKVRPHDVEVE